MTSKFQRSKVGKNRVNVADNPGRIAVAVSLRRSVDGKLVRGNISRMLSVDNATVGEVFAAIERALFDTEAAS